VHLHRYIQSIQGLRERCHCIESKEYDNYVASGTSCTWRALCAVSTPEGTSMLPTPNELAALRR
jgi:hypothetical protein